MLTEHVADAPVPARVQVPPGVKVTVSVGVVGPIAASVTVTVHFVAWLMTTVDGTQLTVVTVVWTEGPTDTSTLTILVVPK